MDIKKGHERTPLAFAITETGEDSKGGGDSKKGGDSFDIDELTSGIRERSADSVIGRKPMMTLNYGDDINIPPSTKRYMEYLSGLLPLADEINRLQDRDGAVMAVRIEAEEMLGRADMAEYVMEDACTAINSFKIPFVNSITESGRARWLRGKAIVVLLAALQKLEAIENNILCTPIDWPELENFDVRGSMPVSDVDHMVDDLSRITEVFNEVILILNEHLDVATDLRDQSNTRFDSIKKQLQVALEGLTGRSEISVLDIYEIIGRLQN